MRLPEMKIFWIEGPLSWIGSRKPGAAETPGPGGGQAFKKSAGPSRHARELCGRLLGIGGRSVVVPFVEESVSALLKEGAPADAPKVVLRRGRANDCHGNSARLWLKNAARLKIATGYALSKDGIWRRHTWLRDGPARVIETTERRTLYFGVPLAESMAKSFCEAYLES